MEKKIYGVIYGLIDGTNDFEYIGQTTRSVELRFKEHAKDPYYIGSAIRAHGEDMFVIVILKVCYSRAELDFWERHFIKSRDTMVPNGYNLTEGGERTSGLKSTPERRAKIKVALTGKKKSPEHCANISLALRGENQPLFGKHFSAEQSFKCSAKLRGDSPYKNLICELDKHKLSYAALAKLLGLTDVSKKMLGKKNFTARDIEKLVKFFGKPTKYLLIRDDGKKFWKLKCNDSQFKNLLAVMEERQLSYTALAKLTGLSRPTISGKMSGKILFTEEDIAKLVKIFGLPADYLMSRDDGLPAILSEAEKSLNLSKAQRSDTPYKNLLCEMDKRNLSYGELAKLLGLSSVSVSLKMRGKVKFTAAQVAKLVEIFDKPADYLMSRDDGLSAILSEAEKSLNLSKAQRSDTAYKNLLCEMDKRNLSYVELAKLLGLCHQSVSLKMRGKVKFTAKDIAKLVEIFGKPADYLLMI